MSLLRTMIESVVGPAFSAPERTEENYRGYNGSTTPYTGTDDDGEQGWMLVSQGGQILGPEGKAGKHPIARIEVRSELRKAIRFNPHGRATAQSYTKYAIGRDCRPRWPDSIYKDDKKRKALEAFWKAISMAWNWPEFSVEVGIRFLRDGENILRRFSDTVPVYVDGNPAARRMLIPRFIDPERIRNPQNGSEEEGVVTAKGDVQRPVLFNLVKADDFSTLEAQIQARDIIFVKTEVDGNERRGYPMLTSVMPYIPMHDGWLLDRINLNRVRSSVALVRTFDGSATDIRSALEREDATAKARGDRLANTRGSDDMKTRRIRPGTILNARKGVKYEFISPNLQASDVAQDGRNIRLAVAAGGGLAEFMVSADAANASYAQNLASEGPAIKTFIDFQGLLRMVYQRALCWATEYEREYGRGQFDIPEDFDPTSVTWDFPRMTTRNRIHEVQADLNLVQSGCMSRRTAMARDDIDYDVEQARMVSEGPDFLKIAPTIPSAKGSTISDPSTTVGPGGSVGTARDRGPNQDPNPNDQRAVDPGSQPSNV